jgi:hypothetical protein
MPSTRGIAFIALFWLATVGYVGYRDVWPRLVRDAAPTVWIDLSDEATQAVPVRWGLFRGDVRVGTVLTQMNYDAATDQFRFVTKYREFQLDVQPIRCSVPEMELTTLLNRSGALCGQSMHGTLIAKYLGLKVATGTARIDCMVRDGELVGICRLDSEYFPTIEEPLEPTPVPDGQVLNPLQPVNRLRGVRPGLRWVIYANDPLGDAIANATAQVLKKKGVGSSLFTPKPTERKSMIATVSDVAEPLRTVRGDFQCWAIEVRGDQGTATIWVRASDGFVMRQVAQLNGETLRLERED